jgi:hypothetical protein
MAIRAIDRCFWAAGLAACFFMNACARPAAKPEIKKPEQPASAVGQLVGHIWRVEQPTSGFLGTIYIFVADGSLLETSCKETYRIARWSTDQQSPSTIQVVEDGQPAFTGTVLDASGANLRLQRRLRHGETDELKFTAVPDEFVCPDLR